MSDQAQLDSVRFERVIDDICNLKWSLLSREDLINVAWIYYFFSVQFRENLEIARSLYPNDEQLIELDHGERNTDNLSPFLGVATVGEKMNHDEFMRRTLKLTTIPPGTQQRLEAIGEILSRKSPLNGQNDQSTKHCELRGWRARKSIYRHIKSPRLE